MTTEAGRARTGERKARDIRYPLIDSLRALGALSVIAVHAMTTSNTPARGSELVPYIARLDVAVTLFFMISGFVQYRPFVRAHLRGERPPGMGSWAWRRLLRIAPAYWVALTIVALWLSLDSVFTAGGIPVYYGFLQVYSGETFQGGMVQAWTLGVEAGFYLMLPFYALLLRRVVRSRPDRRLRAEITGIGVLIAVSLLYNVIALSQVDIVRGERLGPILNSLAAVLDHLALGMGLAILTVWLEARREEPRAIRVLGRYPAIPLAVALLGFVALTKIGLTTGRVTDAEWLERNILSGVVAVALMLPTVIGETGRGLFRRFLGNRVLLFLGVITYAIYLYHFALLQQFKRWGLDLGDGVVSWLGWVVLALIGSTAIATLSYYLVEKPALRLRKWVPEPKRVEPAPEPLEVAAAGATRGTPP